MCGSGNERGIADREAGPRRRYRLSAYILASSSMDTHLNWRKKHESMNDQTIFEFSKAE